MPDNSCTPIFIRFIGAEIFMKISRSHSRIFRKKIKLEKYKVYVKEVYSSKKRARVELY